jgi:hypothetical protein
VKAAELGEQTAKAYLQRAPSSFPRPLAPCSASFWPRRGSHHRLHDDSRERTAALACSRCLQRWSDGPFGEVGGAVEVFEHAVLRILLRQGFSDDEAVRRVQLEGLDASAHGDRQRGIGAMPWRSHLSRTDSTQERESAVLVGSSGFGRACSDYRREQAPPRPEASSTREDQLTVLAQMLSSGQFTIVRLQRPFRLDQGSILPLVIPVRDATHEALRNI